MFNPFNDSSIPQNITTITDANISKIKRHEFYEENLDVLIKYHGQNANAILDTNKAKNDLLFKATKQLMIHAKQCNSAETLLFIQNSTQTAAYTSQNDYNNVQLNLGMEKALLHNDCETYTLFHNHPSNNNFSVQDILTYIGYAKIEHLAVCTNDCKHTAILLKTNNYKSFIPQVLAQVVNFLIKYGIVNSHGSGAKLINFLTKFGVCYAEVMHY